MNKQRHHDFGTHDISIHCLSVYQVLNSLDFTEKHETKYFRLSSYGISERQNDRMEEEQGKPSTAAHFQSGAMNNNKPIFL